MKLLVHLSGGQLGERLFTAESEEADGGWAPHLFRLSEQGALGKKFSFVPPEYWKPANGHDDEGSGEANSLNLPVCYEVTNCLRLSNCIIVRAKHTKTMVAGAEG